VPGRVNLLFCVLKVHISIADLPFLEAYYIDPTGMAHMKIVVARLEELDIE